MNYQTCEDCGCKVYDGHCVNCHEETYIMEQDMGNDEHVDFSDEFCEKLQTQQEEAREIIKRNRIIKITSKE